MLRCVDVSRDPKDGDENMQSSLVKSFLEFREGEPLTAALLLQESVVLRDPPEVSCQSKLPNGRRTES